MHHVLRGWGPRARRWTQEEVVTTKEAKSCQPEARGQGRVGGGAQPEAAQPQQTRAQQLVTAQRGEPLQRNTGARRIGGEIQGAGVGILRESRRQGGAAGGGAEGTGKA